MAATRENPLVPSNTTETCGGNVIDAVFAKLVHYDAETAEPSNDIAESIETTDNQNFTVKLKPGYKFHDGTEVTAKSFVDAWNYAAYGPNAQSSGYFMEPIEGFGDLQCAGTANPDDPCEGYTPKAKEMTGLKVVDDNTFTIKTTEKVSNLPVRLGYSAFAPLPDAFFTDPKAFGDKPIGAGPFKLDSWTKEQAIVLSKFADYSGDFGGKVDKVTFKIYQDPDAAYNDVIANNLDVTDEIPAERPDRRQVQVGPARPQRAEGVRRHPDDHCRADQGRPELRRPEDQAGASRWRSTATPSSSRSSTAPASPATGWVSPVVDGYKADQCGEFCKYDPAKAKALLAEAGGFKGDKITLSYNADAAHKEWTEATCNSIKQALGVECQAVGVVDFATFRSQIARPQDEGPVPHRLADGLPLDRELPRPDLRDRRVLERRRLLQPGVRQAPRRGVLLPPTRPLPTPSTRRPRRCSRTTCPPSRCGTARPRWAGRTRSPV